MNYLMTVLDVGYLSILGLYKPIRIWKDLTRTPSKNFKYLNGVYLKPKIPRYKKIDLYSSGLSDGYI